MNRIYYINVFNENISMYISLTSYDVNQKTRKNKCSLIIRSLF